MTYYIVAFLNLLNLICSAWLDSAKPNDKPRIVNSSFFKISYLINIVLYFGIIIFGVNSVGWVRTFLYSIVIFPFTGTIVISFLTNIIELGYLFFFINICALIAYFYMLFVCLI